MTHCLNYTPYTFVSELTGKEYFLYKTRYGGYYFSERCKRFALSYLPDMKIVIEDPGTGVPRLETPGQG